MSRTYAGLAVASAVDLPLHVSGYAFCTSTDGAHWVESTPGTWSSCEGFASLPTFEEKKWQRYEIRVATTNRTPQHATATLTLQIAHREPAKAPKAAKTRKAAKARRAA